MGGVKTTLQTKMFCIDLIDKNGQKEKIVAYGIDTISSDITSIKLDNVVHKFADFNVSLNQVIRPTGKIDILIGQRYARLHPSHLKTIDDLVLYNSMFGSGWLIGGYSQQLSTERTKKSQMAQTISHANISIKPITGSPREVAEPQ